MADFDKAQNDAESELFVAVERLLGEKHAAHDWNPSTTADQVVDLLVAAGWKRP